MKFKRLKTSLTAAALLLGMAGLSAQAADLRVGVEGAYPPHFRGRNPTAR